jgi:hypothetical protein
MHPVADKSYQDNIAKEVKMEKWQIKMNANAEATERWTRKLLRAANELQKLRQERRRLTSPSTRKAKAAYKSLDDIPRMAAGGSEFNDEIPL